MKNMYSLEIFVFVFDTYACSLVLGSDRSARRKKQAADGKLDTPTVSLTAASVTDLDNITQHQIVYKKVNVLSFLQLFRWAFLIRPAVCLLCFRWNN